MGDYVENVDDVLHLSTVVVILVFFSFVFLSLSIFLKVVGPPYRVHSSPPDVRIAVELGCSCWFSLPFSLFTINRVDSTIFFCFFLFVSIFFQGTFGVLFGVIELVVVLTVIIIPVSLLLFVDRRVRMVFGEDDEGASDVLHCRKIRAIVQEELIEIGELEYFLIEGEP